MAKNYEIDFQTSTLILTKSFIKRLERYDPVALAEYKKLSSAFSDMNIIGKPKQHRTNKTQITYAKMIKYMSCVQNSEEHLRLFEAVREASLSQQSPYNYVRNWFLATFPDYREMPNMDETGRIIIDENATIYPFPELEKEA